jgi:hypothetical protein
MFKAARTVVAVAAAALLVGCGARVEDSNRRILHAHNLLRHAGYGGMGPVSSGEVPAGETRTHEASFGAGFCYVLVVFGGEGLEDVGVTVTAPDGSPVAEDRSAGSTSVVSFCVEREGEHQVAVAAASGGGSYQLAYWYGGGEGAEAGAGSGGGNALTLGRPVSGVLPPGERYVDYTLRVTEGRGITIDLMSDDFDCYLYLLVDGREIDRNDDGGSGLNSRISRFVEPGTYTVRVGSFMDSGSGRFTLTAR